MEVVILNRKIKRSFGKKPRMWGKGYGGHWERNIQLGRSRHKG